MLKQKFIDAGKFQFILYDSSFSYLQLPFWLKELVKGIANMIGIKETVLQIWKYATLTVGMSLIETFTLTPDLAWRYCNYDTIWTDFSKIGCLHSNIIQFYKLFKFYVF